MGRIQIILPDELEQKIRIRIGSKGYKKGDLSKELTKIIKKWMNGEKKNVKI